MGRKKNLAQFKFENVKKEPPQMITRYFFRQNFTDEKHYILVQRNG